jgi:tetratricopeptide (TPR) repeat protein
MTTFVQRGFAATRAGNLTEAAECFSQAVADDPDDIEALAWLGQTLCGLGRRHEGIAALREAGQYLLENAEDDGDISLVLEIMQQLQQWNDFEGAADLGTRATRIDAANARAFQLLAVSHAQLNRKTEALQAGEQSLRLAPDNPMMQVLQGSLEADAGRSEEAKRRLQALLDEGLDARAAFRAHKELARVLDRLGEYGQVFPHLHAAAALARTLPEYTQQNAALLPDLIRANTAGFDRALMKRWSGADFTQERPAPVFLIGFFRSGTTLTQEVLDVHPDVFVADETDFIWAVHRELHRMDPSHSSTADKLRKLDLAGVKHLRAFYWTRAQARFGDALVSPVFIDKFTLNTIDLGLINCIFPDAKVVFVMRDPRDVCLSCTMQLMVPTPATVHLLDWQETVNFYGQVMTWWMHIKQQMTLDCFEFRYEDAVMQFEPTYRRLFDFLGLPWIPEVTEFHRHAATKHVASPSRSQVAQPLYSSSVGRWRHYQAEFAPVSASLRLFVDAFNYSQD